MTERTSSDEQRKRIADEQQKFIALVGRIFSDEKFARLLEQDPEQALQQAGFQLDAEQRRTLASIKGESMAMGGDVRAVALVRPVVQVTAGPMLLPVPRSVPVPVVTSSKDDKKR